MRATCRSTMLRYGAKTPPCKVFHRCSRDYSLILDFVVQNTAILLWRCDEQEISHELHDYPPSFGGMLYDSRYHELRLPIFTTEVLSHFSLSLTWTNICLLWIDRHQKIYSIRLGIFTDSPGNLLVSNEFRPSRFSISIPELSLGVLLTIPAVFLESLWSFWEYPILPLKFTLD